MGYMRVIKQTREGTTERNRPAAATATARRFNKLCGQQEWYNVASDEITESEDPQTAKIRRRRAKDQRKIESCDVCPLDRRGPT